MLWCDKVAAQANPDIPHIINDSKTPSGRVHVGALRGVLIHDAVYRSMKARGLDVTYRFGVDDYDPVDEIPYGEAEHFEQHLGKPLCEVPPPAGSSAKDMAEHFMAEFWDIFDELGVKVEKYRMRDIYRSGQFNEAIDRILRSGDEVRQIYYDVSKSEKSDSWIPFQAVCENCGRIGTVEVVNYDGKEVEYHCRPNMVSWARGCGHHGKVSPFDGNGKLPWKLEWVAKWHTFPVTVEGAGKDHSTKGGSRDVSSACLRKIFRGKPPINVPYEFFLVDGQKMSSSKGLGASARVVANLLPPEILRFLILQTQPNRPVNFSPGQELLEPKDKRLITEKYAQKIFNDFDRLHHRAFNDPKAPAEVKELYDLSALDQAVDYFDLNFQIVCTLVQMPHLNLEDEAAKLKGSALTELEKVQLQRRAAAAKYWVENFAEESELTKLQDTLPAAAADLTPAQRGFLLKAADSLEAATDWTSENLQATVFNAARTTPLPAGSGFKAIYCALLNRGDGPRAGNLIAFLDKEYVVNQFREVSVDTAELWRDTAISTDDYEAWRNKNAKKITSISAEIIDSEAFGLKNFKENALEVKTELDGGRLHVHRILFSTTEDANQFIATLS